jgi:hypothetical protein
LNLLLGYVLSPESGDEPLGTAYLIAPDLAITCEHVVRRIKESERLLLNLQGKNCEARIIDTDPVADCALLQLEPCIDNVEPLPLGRGCVAGQNWTSCGYPELARLATGMATAVTLSGSVNNTRAKDPSGAESVQLSSPQLAHGADVSGFSGSPVIIDGEIVAHITGQLPAPDGGSQLLVLWACPVSSIRALLERQASKLNPQKGLLRLLDAMRNQLNFCHVGVSDPNVQQVQLLKELADDLRAGKGLDLRYHYLGPVCAQNWIELSSNSRYGRLSAQHQLTQVAPELASALNDSLRRGGPFGAASLVSLGCGDGTLDRVILEQLMEHRVPVHAYFPVDISPELLQCAIRKVRESTSLKPVGIISVLADLWELERVSEIWPSPPHVELYTLLGYTMGNFLPEALLMRNIASLMGPEDFLLVDARCYAGSIGEDLKSGLGQQLIKQLKSFYDHEANARFAAGPLSFRTQRIPTADEVFNDVQCSQLSGVQNSLVVATKLRLDEGWREQLGMRTSPQGTHDYLKLAWSTVYNEEILGTWFGRVGFDVVSSWAWKTSELLLHKIYLLRMNPGTALTHAAGRTSGSSVDSYRLGSDLPH